MKIALIVLSFIGVWIYAIPFACLAQARAPESSLQVTPAVTRLLIDSIRQSLCRNYIFPDSAQKMTKYVEKEFKKGAYAAITDPKKLADQLQQDLQKAHHDGHLRIVYDPHFARDLSDTTDRINRQRQGDSMQLVRNREDNFRFQEIKRLPGNIGYNLQKITREIFQTLQYTGAMVECLISPG